MAGSREWLNQVQQGQHWLIWGCREHPLKDCTGVLDCKTEKLPTAESMYLGSDQTPNCDRYRLPAISEALRLGPAACEDSDDSDVDAKAAAAPVRQSRRIAGPNGDSGGSGAKSGGPSSARTRPGSAVSVQADLSLRHCLQVRILAYALLRMR